jgi:hypothetical protein
VWLVKGVGIIPPGEFVYDQTEPIEVLKRDLNIIALSGHFLHQKR